MTMCLLIPNVVHNLNHVLLKKKKKKVISMWLSLSEATQCPRSHGLIGLQNMITLEQHLEPIETYWWMIK